MVSYFLNTAKKFKTIRIRKILKFINDMMLFYNFVSRDQKFTAYRFVKALGFNTAPVCTYITTSMETGFRIRSSAYLGRLHQDK